MARLEKITEKLLELNSCLKGYEKQLISVQVDTSLATVYNYLNGQISNRHLAFAIVEAAEKIIAKRENK